MADLSIEIDKQNKVSFAKAYNLAINKGWKIFTVNGKSIILKGIDSLGFPLYYKTFDNNHIGCNYANQCCAAGGEFGT